MPTYRCAQSRFSHAEYLKMSRLFFPLSPDWGAAPRYRLAELWRRGRKGAISIFPILGFYANASYASHLDLSKEKLARLGGIDQASVGKAAAVLEELQIARSRLRPLGGHRITQWDILPGLAVASETQGVSQRRLKETYFYLSGRIVGGGNWASLSGASRALYLGLATRAKKYTSPPDQGLLRWRLPDGVWLGDLELAYTSSGEGDRHLRLVLDTSITDICRITGLSQGAVKSAIRALKSPRIWPGATGGGGFRYQPLAIYPDETGTLIYHFRDHADPWPWAQLNTLRRRHARTPGAAAGRHL